VILLPVNQDDASKVALVKHGTRLAKRRQLSTLNQAIECRLSSVLYVPRALTRTRKTKALLPCPRLGRRPGSALREGSAPAAVRPQTPVGDISIWRPARHL
jgi:hypothetical protein